MRGIVGAYCAAPPDLAARPDDETAWYQALAAESAITGLELPFAGTLHPGGVDRMFELLPPHWRNVVSDIPGTDRASRADRRYGLASEDEEGRSAAIADVRVLHGEVRRLAGLVSAVEVHSAPTGGTADALARSLTQIGSWDWGEAALCLEHVDAATPDHPAEKGYLSLDDEIRAVARATEQTGVPIRQSINWGRSAIEGRSARTPAEHVAALREAGTLGGLIFSGAAAHGPEAWKDSHLGMSEADPGSLLGESELAATHRQTRGAALLFLGVKMRAPLGLPADALVADRLAPSLRALAALGG